MTNNGDIIIIDDDADDREILQDVFNQVLEKNGYENKVVFLSDGYEALEYLKSLTVQPFIIISDINMPRMNGFELREIIFNDDKLKNLCIPYVFLTTSEGSTDQVIQAYQMSVQGFFKKYDTMEEYCEMVEELLRYWKRSLKPYTNQSPLDSVNN